MRDFKTVLILEDNEVEIKIKNYTPHLVTVKLDYHEYTYPSYANCRVTDSTKEIIGTLKGVPIYKYTVGQIINEPIEEDGVYYIVSRQVKDRLPNRDDLLVPADIIRDGAGKIIGCQGFTV